jgi:hypothetical protein
MGVTRRSLAPLRREADPEIVRSSRRPPSRAQRRGLCPSSVPGFADDRVPEPRGAGARRKPSTARLSRVGAGGPRFPFNRALPAFGPAFWSTTALARAAGRAGDGGGCIVELAPAPITRPQAAAEPVLRRLPAHRCRRVAPPPVLQNLDRCLAQSRSGARGVAWAAADRKTTNWPMPITPMRDRLRPAALHPGLRRRAYALYRPHHVERGAAMLLKAVGRRRTAASAWSPAASLARDAPSRRRLAKMAA